MFLTECVRRFYAVRIGILQVPLFFSVYIEYLLQLGKGTRRELYNRRVASLYA